MPKLCYDILERRHRSDGHQQEPIQCDMELGGEKLEVEIFC